MLIPQSIAYASLAGLPPEAGLYASILPLLLYALFGTSRVLAVGPVAIVSLMTATAIGSLAPPGSDHYGQIAVTLALLSGLFLLAMSALRLGFLANFLSHPVIAGFITASALIIGVSQLPSLLGIVTDGGHFFSAIYTLGVNLTQIHPMTSLIGLGSIAFLMLVRHQGASVLSGLGLSSPLCGILTKAAPAVCVAVTALFVGTQDLDKFGVKIVGAVPQGLPPLTIPSWDLSLWQQIAVSALLISIVGFVESVSVGQTLAAKKRERVTPNRELIALGSANVGAAFTGGLPVTGGFARSVVNFDAGAQTQIAGVLTALGILIITMAFTPLLYYIPQAVLSATIIVAVLSLVDIRILHNTWRYSRYDFVSAMTTIVVTLVFGIETGLLAGVIISLALYLLKTSRPHIAEVGLVPGTEHFRNVLRHTVATSPDLVTLRVDESLYFANARALEDRVNDLVASRPALAHLVLQCSAINDIDASALESLETINHRLNDAGIKLHLSEVKGPVMDRLQRSALLDHISGKVYLSQYQAIGDLTPQVIQSNKR
jgi:SulP family sulfate permease